MAHKLRFNPETGELELDAHSPQWANSSPPLRPTMGGRQLNRPTTKAAKFLLGLNILYASLILLGF